MNKKLIMRRTFTFDVNAFDMQINVSPLELKQVKSRIYNSLLERSITPHHSVTYVVGKVITYILSERERKLVENR